MKHLILYYSYGGNTRKIAENIQRDIGGDIEEIETVKPYTGSYDSVVSQGQREVNSGYMPELKPLKSDLSTYDCIILGSPVWWYTFAPAMKSFLHQHDLAGKTIYPFATNGGWLGHTFEDYRDACSGADVKAGLNLVFDGKKMRSKQSEVNVWLKQFKK